MKGYDRLRSLLCIRCCVHAEGRSDVTANAAKEAIACHKNGVGSGARGRPHRER